VQSLLKFFEDIEKLKKDADKQEKLNDGLNEFLSSELLLDIRDYFREHPDRLHLLTDINRLSLLQVIQIDNPNVNLSDPNILNDWINNELPVKTNANVIATPNYSSETNQIYYSEKEKLEFVKNNQKLFAEANDLYFVFYKYFDFFENGQSLTESKILEIEQKLKIADSLIDNLYKYNFAVQNVFWQFDKAKNGFIFSSTEKDGYENLGRFSSDFIYLYDLIKIKLRKEKIDFLSKYPDNQKVNISLSERVAEHLKVEFTEYQNKEIIVNISFDTENLPKGITWPLHIICTLPNNKKVNERLDYSSEKGIITHSFNPEIKRGSDGRVNMRIEFDGEPLQVSD
jgi:hypothetical protein